MLSMEAVALLRPNKLHRATPRVFRNKERSSRPWEVGQFGGNRIYDFTVAIRSPRHDRAFHAYTDLRQEETDRCRPVPPIANAGGLLTGAYGRLLRKLD